MSHRTQGAAHTSACSVLGEERGLACSWLLCEERRGEPLMSSLISLSSVIWMEGRNEWKETLYSLMEFYNSGRGV